MNNLQIWKTVVRLLKEFAFPFGAALAWTFGIKRAASFEIFVPAFFLASWATGQFVRVRKQARVEGDLANIEVRVTKLLADLERHTKVVIAELYQHSKAVEVRIDQHTKDTERRAEMDKALESVDIDSRAFIVAMISHGQSVPLFSTLMWQGTTKAHSRGAEGYGVKIFQALQEHGFTAGYRFLKKGEPETVTFFLTGWGVEVATYVRDVENVKGIFTIPPKYDADVYAMFHKHCPI